MATKTLLQMRTQVADQLNEGIEDHSSAIDRAIIATVQSLERTFNLPYMKRTVTFTPDASGLVIFPRRFKNYTAVQVWESRDEVLQTGRLQGIMHFKHMSDAKPPHFFNDTLASYGESVGIPTMFIHQDYTTVTAGRFIGLPSDTEGVLIKTLPFPEQTFLYRIYGWVTTYARELLADSDTHDLFDEADELIETGALVRLARRLHDQALRQLALADFQDYLQAFILGFDNVEESEAATLEMCYQGENEDLMDYAPRRSR